MKTVITAAGTDLNAPFDKRFGRAASFCVFDEATGETQFVVNESANASGGAGTNAAAKMVELGVTKVVSGDFGPKAKDMLEKFNIQMVIIQDDNSTIQDIINKFKS